MEIILFQSIMFLSLVLFFLQKKQQFYIALLLHVGIIVLSSKWAIQSLFFTTESLNFAFMPFLGKMVYLEIDNLSAFFILVVNFTSLTGILYAKAYLKPYLVNKSKAEFALHYFSFIWLHISMLLVVMLRDGLLFLVIWEIMSLSSFFLVIFESEKSETIKIGLNYLLQMHIGVVFILIAFLWTAVYGDSELSFNGLELYFSKHNPWVVFLLFFIGFGIKAGFIPLHSWLPHAHPAAPSHVSGVMSGVMIKMGIYGILRVLSYIHTELLGIGLFILVISLSSGLIGVSLAIVQHDVKKLLAFHSIENIGIIGIGIGLGVIGLAINNPLLATMGFAGGILHILNHSLFKSLLFYTAGSVYNQTHTRNIEQLGGLIKKMPKTAIFFLLGALAISGLPPFNGFISEFLLYFGMFKSLHTSGLTSDMILLFSFSGLAIIGGLAIFCFTKVFSIIFLGNSRSQKTALASEVETSMQVPYYFISFLILFIGLAPILVIPSLSKITQLYVHDIQSINLVVDSLNKVSISAVIFFGFIALLWFLRAWQQKKSKITEHATWGCGYTGANPAVHQYTATSYADNFGQIAKQIVNVKKEFEEFEEEEIFPKSRKFETHSNDLFEENLISKPSNKLLLGLEKIAIFQTGKIQHYLLYAFVFVAVILALNLFNLI